MKKTHRLRSTLILLLSVNLSLAGCAAKQTTTKTETDESRITLFLEESDTPPDIAPIAPGSFAAVKVSGLNAKDAKAFAAAMQDKGWIPEITCLGNHCDIGTRSHFETAATIVFLSGHGYVGNPNGYFLYSDLEQAVHKDVIRADGDTERYTFGDQLVWSEEEEYSRVVAHQQKQNTDWMVISACNQLRNDTRVSVFEAMQPPSDHPLKAVLGYGSYQGSNRDELVLEKFVSLCQNGSGKERVAHAWFAAHETYAPTLAARVRVAVRDGFQNDTLTSPPAGSNTAGHQIRLWWMSRGDRLSQPNTDIPEELAVEITLLEPVDNAIDLIHTENVVPGDSIKSEQIAVAAITQSPQIPEDFQLHRTNTIIECDMDGSNEAAVATMHTFARYINGILVSVDPVQGEYLNFLIDGTSTGELDWHSRCSTRISTDDAIIMNREDLISKDEAVTLGLKNSKLLQEEHYGYAPAELALKSIEPIYVISPDDPQKLVLAWNVIDDQSVYVIIDARSGDVLYWSD